MPDSLKDGGARPAEEIALLIYRTQIYIPRSWYSRYTILEIVIEKYYSGSNMKKNSEYRDLFPGALELMVLRSLSRTPMHGYALAQQIKYVSDALPRMIMEDDSGTMHHLRAVHGIPVDWTQLSAADIGNGTLRFEYAWASSTGPGHLADLATCRIGEKVSYNGITTKKYSYPSPPFAVQSWPNPGYRNMPAAGGRGEDDQLIKQPFVTPYISFTIPATQYFRYECAGDSHYTYLAGPNLILKSVAQHPDGSWYYLVTKSGSSATIDPLP